MRVKQLVLRALGKRKLNAQFDQLCQIAISQVVESIYVNTRPGDDVASILKLRLEAKFDQLLKTDRLIRNYMVIDARWETGQVMRGIVNVQPLSGDGYARYQFGVVGGRLDFTISHVSPRYV